MLKRYFCGGIDRESGDPRSATVIASTTEDATMHANRVGILPETVSPVLPATTSWGVYRTLFAVLKNLTFFAAFAVLFYGIPIANSAIEETTVVALACFVGIIARIFQAEEHSRK